MTREEAILWMRVLKHSKINWVGEKAEEEDIIKACEEAEQEAFDIAIESLQKDIERHERVIRASERHLGIVRCKDCKHWHSNTEFCGIWSFQNIAQRTLSDDYCSRAERREE